jgi:hypothetical protein
MTCTSCGKEFAYDGNNLPVVSSVLCIFCTAVAEHKQLIAAVREYALAHYEEGWDIVVEAWSDADISRELETATTTKGAIARIRPLVEIYYDRRRDIEGTIF